MDTQFDSLVYRELAMRYVKDFYNERLNEEDFFGLISLDESKQASKDEIILERRSANMNMKQNLMKDIADRDVDYVSSSAGESSKAIRLERALEKAYEW